MAKWELKFGYNEVAVLRKSKDLDLDVRIEGVSVRKNDTPIYSVREVITGEGYPAAETSLKRQIRKIPKESQKV